MTPEQIYKQAIEVARHVIEEIGDYDAGGNPINHHDLTMRAIIAYEKAMWRPFEEAPKGYLLQAAWRNELGNLRTTFVRFYPAGSLDAYGDKDADENGCAPEGWYEDPGEREEIYPWEPPAGALLRWPDYSPLSESPEVK